MNDSVSVGGRAVTAERSATPAGARAVVWLRLEGAAVLVAALVAYAAVDASWLVFAALLLAPDLAMLGYLAGPRAGATAYNALHVYVGPAALMAAGLAGVAWSIPVALVWLAHIGMDRALGYGLKLPTGFRETHLGTIGRG